MAGAYMIVWCLFLVFLIVIACSSFFVFFSAVYNTDKKKQKPPVDLVAWQKGKAMLQAKEEQRTCQEWQASCPLDKVQIKTSKGLTLCALTKPAATPCNTWVILLHGYTGHKEEMFQHARYCLQQGYNILLPDFRNHGESDGHIIRFGVEEYADLLYWMDWVQRDNAQAKFVLFGVSMGATTAIMASNRDSCQGRITAIIADSPYTNPYDQLGNVLAFYKIRRWPILPLVNVYSRIFLHMNLKAIKTIDELQQLKVPVLFIAGSEDHYSPYKEQMDIYQNSHCVKELYVAPGGVHICSVFVDPKTYYERIFTFIETYDRLL